LPAKPAVATTVYCEVVFMLIVTHEDDEAGMHAGPEPGVSEDALNPQFDAVAPLPCM